MRMMATMLLLLVAMAGMAAASDHRASCSAVTELGRRSVKTHGCHVNERCLRAYVASLDHGVYEFDVSDPTTDPKETRFVKGGRSNWLETNGEYVYTADGKSMGVYRFPADGSAATKVMDLMLPGALSGGLARNLYLKGDKVYVGLGPERGMMVVDVSTKDAPTLDGYLAPGGGEVVRPIEGTKYVLMTDKKVGVVVVDISTTPFTAVHTYPLVGAHGLEVMGNRAYVGTTKSADNVLEELDISNPLAIGMIQSKDIGYKARHFEVHGMLVYVAGDVGGVFVYDKAAGMAEILSHNLGNRQVTGLTVRGDIIFATTAHDGYLYVLRADCGLRMTFPAFPEVKVMEPGEADVMVPHVDPMGAGELDGWVHRGDGSKTHVKNLPSAFKKGLAFFPEQVDPLKKETRFWLKCPDNRCGRPCEFFIAVWHCPPCTKQYNGGLPGVLPPAGWEPRSCAPKWAKDKGGRYEPMVTFRKVVEEGKAETTPATDRELKHVMIFAVPDSTDCDERETKAACEETSACQWRDEHCVRVWCPTGPTGKPGGAPTCEPCQAP